MKTKLLPVFGFIMTLAIVNFSCQKELLKEREIAESPAAEQSKARLNLTSKHLSTTESRLKALAQRADDPVAWLKAKLAKPQDPKAVTPTECGPTKLDEVIDKYVSQFGPLEFEFYGDYATINVVYSYYLSQKQYFGAKGENTQLVVKTQRSLEKFWSMPDEITIKGEHNSTLNDHDKIVQTILFLGYSSDFANYYADLILYINTISDVFVESPLLSIDGFATTEDIILIGDGLISILAETGLDNNIVVAGVLSHEWGHQVQFNNATRWYGAPFEAIPSSPEFTRYTELQADFFSSYYLTHKRGATYNWKRVREFLQLFFSIGDCAFTSAGHHGTPDQRFAAATLGYHLADETLPHGKILSPDALNTYFVAHFQEIISNSVPQ